MSSRSDSIVFMGKITNINAIKADIREKIIKKGENFVGVIVNPEQMKKIVFFPTSAVKSIYTKISLAKETRLDDAFFISLREKIAKFKLKTLFTTGVCFKLDECFWEGIFEYFDGFKIEDLENEFKTIDNVVSVDLDVLSVD